MAFTDGSSRGNPGPGGYGAVVVIPHDNSSSEKTVVELGGGYENTTNNRMELTAVIQALAYCCDTNKQGDSIHVRIYTDSRYVLKGVTQWVPVWKQNGWKTKNNNDVKNIDLWKRLERLIHYFSVDWQLLKGHAGIVGNERADEIATAFADTFVQTSDTSINLYNGPLSEYGYNITDVTHAKLVETNTQKKKHENHRSGKAYSYVSMVDGVVQVHETWDACKERVTGKHAWFRKAMNKQDEQDIISRFQASSTDV